MTSVHVFGGLAVLCTGLLQDPTPSADALVEALSSSELDVRLDAARIGWRVRDPAVQEALARAARRDRHQMVRAYAAESLGRSGADGAADLLLDLAALDPNHLVRGHALIGLGATHDPDAFDVLAKALADPNVGGAAASGLALLGDPRALPLIEARVLAHGPDVRGFAECAAAALQLDRERTLSMLLALLADGKVGEARAVVHALAPFGGDLRVRNAAENALHDERLEVRRAAIALLGASESLRAVALLLGRVDDEVELRADVLDALGELAHEFAVDPIVRWLGADDPAVRIAAVRALARIAHPTATRALRDVLRTTREPIVQIHAMVGLGRIGDPDVLPELVLHFRDTGFSAQEDRYSGVHPFPENVFVRDVAWWAARRILDGREPCALESLLAFRRDAPRHDDAELAALRREIDVLEATKAGSAKGRDRAPR